MMNDKYDDLLHIEVIGYSEMLRLHKRYDFGYHMTSSKNSRLTPGQKMVFTSYPAAIYSRDDFYQIKGESVLTIAGVAITNFNRSLWNESQFEEKVIMAPRVLAANRLSKNGKDWGNIIALKQSGTGNKQWLVISGSNRHERNLSASAFSLWVIEQVPSLTISRNKTDVLKKQGYWVNIGIPYYEEIQKISGYGSKENEDATTKAKLLTPLQNILIQGSINVVDVNTLTALMRSPEITAAGRSDIILLNVTNANGTGDMPKVVGDNGFSVQYKYHGAVNNYKGAGHSNNQVGNGFHDYLKGMTDEKTTKDRVRGLENRRKWEKDGALFGDLNFTEYAGMIDLKVADGHEKYSGLAGPPYNPTYLVEPFRWSSSLLRKVPHYGQVDLWAFQPVQPGWVW